MRSKSARVDLAAADPVRGNLGLLGDDTGGELLGRISSEKKPTMPPLVVSVRPSGDFAAPGVGDVEGDVGGQRGLAHAGTARHDDQVGRLQAAHLVVEIDHAVEMPASLPSR